MLDQIKNSPFVSQILEKYLALNSRDRVTVSILVAVTMMIVILFGLILPAYSYKESSHSRYRSKLDAFEYIKNNEQLITSQNKQSVARDSDQSLLGLANTTSKEFSIDFKRYEPAGDNGLGLWFEDVSFNNVVLWLEKLDKSYNIHVTEIVIDRQDSNGVVNVRLELQG